MSSKYIFLSIFIFFSVGKITARVKFTNIKCTSLDTNFDDFEYCRLKSVNSTFKYISLKVNLYKIPITKVKVKFALLKTVSGHRSFLYNITADACKILKYPKSNPVFGFFYNLFRDYSNINHTCPLNHDLIVDKFPTEFMNTQIINVLPFPLGDYQFHSTWIADDISRAEVRVYGTLF